MCPSCGIGWGTGSPEATQMNCIRGRGTPYVLAFCAASILATAEQARANHIISLTSGLETVTITDQDFVGNPATCNGPVCPDEASVNGVVQWSGSVGGWMVNVTTGVTTST